MTGAVTGEVARVQAGDEPRSYPVVVRRGLLADLAELVSEFAPAHRYAVLSDDTVAPLHGRAAVDALDGAGLSAALFTFPAGEENKTRESWIRLTDTLLEERYGRDSVVVAVGGGVTGDLAGFVAATFLRGVPVVQVPTSVVAMVDASVGGKTGVDTTAGKNLVGAFHPPRLVAADPDVVTTLPRAQRAQGFAEAVKHGAILDGPHVEELAAEAPSLLEGDPDSVERVVRRSVALKADVVSRDEREGGLREILNFGHTLGHALEAAGGYAMAHGSAVAAGMVLEARLGEEIGVTAPGTSHLLARIVETFELPPRPPGGLDVEEVLAFTRSDKKGRKGRARYVLLREPGRVEVSEEGWSHDVEEGVVRAVLEEAQRLSG